MSLQPQCSAGDCVFEGLITPVNRSLHGYCAQVKDELALDRRKNCKEAVKTSSL